MGCAFCSDENVSIRAIKDDGLVFAFPNHTPVVPGHILLVPKRHVLNYEELTDEEKVAMEAMRVALRDALRSTFSAEGFNFAWNESVVGGQSVPHLHLHILPRKAGDAGVHGYEPREFLYRPIAASERPQTPQAELEAVAALIRSAIA